MAAIHTRFNNQTSFQQDMIRGKIQRISFSKNSYLIVYIIGRKRRNSEDEEMAECTTATTRRSSKPIKLSELKRQKTGVQKRSTRGALLGRNEQ